MTPVADAHCDFLYYMVNAGYDIMDRKPPQTMYLPYLKEGNVKLQFFAAWTDTSLKRDCFQQCIDMTDAYWRMLDAYPDDFVPLSAGYDPSTDKIATVLSVEGGEAFNGCLENVRILHRLGVRAATLTWNHKNELAYPGTGRLNKGLTELGRKIVKEMCRVGIAIDVSHLSDAGIDELLDISTRPIFASHSNARAICDTPRALCDRHISAIAQQGGIVCANYYPGQLTLSGQASITNIAAHIEHIVKLAGIDHVGLGSDFDGMNVYPRDLHDPRDVQALLCALTLIGFNKEEIYKIAYSNLRDYIVKFV